MTIKQVDCFLAVVENKTFTLAAEELYISQSSLSKQIKALETELGYILFRRENKENALTDEGKIFLSYARSFSREYAALMRTLNKGERKGAKQSVKVGILPIIQAYSIDNELVLFQSLIASSNRYIDLVKSTQQQLLENLKSRKIEAAILRTDNMDMRMYEYVPVVEDELVVAYSDEIADFNKQKSVSIEQIAQYPLIVFNESSDLHKTAERILSEAGVSVEYEYEFNGHEQILSVVNAGLGVAFMPSQLLSKEKYPNVRYVSLENPVVCRTSLVRLKDAPATKTIELLFNYFSSLNE